MTPDELRAWRTAHGLTLAQMAERLGVSRQTVHRWEVGTCRIPGTVPLALQSLTTPAPVN